MKNKKLKKKIKELKVMLLCLNAYGNLNIQGVSILEHYLNGLLKFKTKKRSNHVNKKLQKRCETLESQLIESHHDIGILDFTNHKLEQECNILEKRLKEYEEIYLEDANDSFDRCLHDIIAKYKVEEGNDFNKSTVGFLLSYIQALKSYSNGDTKSIMQKIEHYKNETYEAKKELNEFKMAKKKVLKKFNKIGQELSSFENMISKSI